MLNKIRKYNLRKAGICSVIIGFITIILHILVITEVLPYWWVNGGRSANYLEAREVSQFSILIILVNLLINMIASEIIPLKLNKFWGITLSVFLIVTLPLNIVGIIQQFLGTTFEKCVTSIITIVAFIADCRIAFEKRW